MRPTFSLGIEEEYQTVDPETRDLRSHIKTEMLTQGPRAAAPPPTPPQRNRPRPRPNPPRDPGNCPETARTTKPHQTAPRKANPTGRQPQPKNTQQGPPRHPTQPPPHPQTPPKRPRQNTKNPTKPTTPTQNAPTATTPTNTVKTNPPHPPKNPTVATKTPTTPKPQTPPPQTPQPPPKTPPPTPQQTTPPQTPPTNTPKKPPTPTPTPATHPPTQTTNPPPPPPTTHQHQHPKTPPPPPPPPHTTTPPNQKKTQNKKTPPQQNKTPPPPPPPPPTQPHNPPPPPPPPNPKPGPPHPPPSPHNPPKKLQQGKRLLYQGNDGLLVPIERIYNRSIVDELVRREIKLPFDYRDELNVEWAGHPNWYFRISKFSIPYLDHPAVPAAVFLDDWLAGKGRERLPQERNRWVLKPLYSFAGQGIQFGPTDAELAAIPVTERHNYLLQERVQFEPVIQTPEGMTQAEIRILYAWPDDGEMTPMISLVRMGRGLMMGVDHNRDRTWVGASAGLTPKHAR